MTDSPQTPSSDRLFNTPLECGLRSVALLFAAYPQSCDVQRLVQYDYLIVHSGDVDGGPESIHPATPHRSGELLVRRSLVEAGLDFMACRRVIERTYSGVGIEYLAGEYAVVFLDALASGYVRQLRDRAEWVVSVCGGKICHPAWRWTCSGWLGAGPAEATTGGPGAIDRGGGSRYFTKSFFGNTPFEGRVGDPAPSPDAGRVRAFGFPARVLRLQSRGKELHARSDEVACEQTGWVEFVAFDRQLFAPPQHIEVRHRRLVASHPDAAIPAPRP